VKVANKKLKKIETDDDDLIKAQEKIISEASAKANADTKSSIDEAQVAEDEAQRLQAIEDAREKAIEADKAQEQAKAEAEAQALIDEQIQAVLNEEAKSVTSFAITENLKKILAIPHEYPDKNEYKSKSTVNLDYFSGVIKEGKCLRIDQLMENSNILNIQVWFLTKTAPKFTVGNMSDFSCYIDCSNGAMQASLQEDGKFDALFAKVKYNDKDVVINFKSDFIGKVKTIITYNV
jgi:multidrug efflux pump subunit AcrA (membrane-fusion protein)